MTAIIAARPPRIARVLPLLAAVCRKEPRPGSRKSRLPRTNISQAIRKNQPPATDIMEFHTRPIVEKGRSGVEFQPPATDIMEFHTGPSFFHDRSGVEFHDVLCWWLVFPDGLRNVCPGQTRLPASRSWFFPADGREQRQHSRDSWGPRGDDCRHRLPGSNRLAAHHRLGGQIQVRTSRKLRRSTDHSAQPHRPCFDRSPLIPASDSTRFQLAQSYLTTRAFPYPDDFVRSN